MTIHRYVVLHHTGVPAPHFDLMYESSAGSPLTTFRCLRWPAVANDVLEELAEHRRTYLDYEGPVSDGRGAVARVESGTCEVVDLTVDPPTFALRLLSDTAERSITLLHAFVDGEASATSWRVIHVNGYEER